MTTRITSENITDATIGTADLASSVPLNTQWQSVFVGDGSTGLTAVAGNGYFIDTTSGTVTVTLPASPSAGDTIVLKDYARTWATNNVSTSSALFDGDTLSNTFNTNGQTITLVYMDGTKGWSLINQDTTSGLGSAYISATGGTILTNGDFKTHIFTGDSSFIVSDGNGPLANVDYFVLAGGGVGGRDHGSGAGAGGFRVSNSVGCIPAPTMSPLSNSCGIAVSPGTYPVTVGGGGTGRSAPNTNVGNKGSDSIFSTITSAGGGGGSYGGTFIACTMNGGSGGGTESCNPSNVGQGNTPPVSPPQGNPGGQSSQPGPAVNYSYANGGGGGAGAAGGNNSGTTAGDGGAGSFIADPFFGPTAPTYGESGPVGSTRYFGGGGGGAYYAPQPGTSGTGGVGGGGNGSIGPGGSNNPGSANMGAGGGGGGPCGGNGGKGLVAIRYRYQA